MLNIKKKFFVLPVLRNESEIMACIGSATWKCTEVPWPPVAVILIGNLHLACKIVCCTKASRRNTG